MSKKELVQLIIENAQNKLPDGEIYVDLSYLDFGDLYLDLAGIKAKQITNSGQQGEIISNIGQVGDEIVNDKQKAKFIQQVGQVAEVIRYEKGE